ncbi:hypothetical protein C8R44DRAFT_988622 [Mycena epipterygia]|nr:hypothetical protein C8R44DRAFT_988622 [Mycena epipterygia]
MSSLSHALSLPAELERHIFELVAFHHPQSMAALLLVAHRVKIWIEPLLYRVLCICFDATRMSAKKPVFQRPLAAILRMVRSRPTLVRENVRHVCFWDYGVYQAGSVIEILTACDATVNLRLPATTLSPTILSLLGKLPLQRLSTSLQSLFSNEIDFTHPLFAQITHLEMGDFMVSREVAWEKLAQIPELTHLSVSEYTSIPICQAALAHCKSLAVLVLACGTEARLDACVPHCATLAVDPRFVMLVVTDYRHNWERGARGDEDHWSRAEALVRKRRAEELDQ